MPRRDQITWRGSFQLRFVVFKPLGSTCKETLGALLEEVFNSFWDSRAVRGCITGAAKFTSDGLTETCSSRTTTFSWSSFLSIWRALNSFSNRSTFIWKLLYTLSLLVFWRRKDRICVHKYKWGYCTQNVLWAILQTTFYYFLNFWSNAKTFNYICCISLGFPKHPGKY